MHPDDYGELDAAGKERLRKRLYMRKVAARRRQEFDRTAARHARRVTRVRLRTRDADIRRHRLAGVSLSVIAAAFGLRVQAVRLALQRAEAQVAR